MMAEHAAGDTISRLEVPKPHGGGAVEASEGEDRASRTSTDVQGLRALAILLVLVYHAGWAPLSGGFVGVDVFFVISGFLITTHLLKSMGAGRLRLSDFYARRIRRIIPASAAVMLLTAVVGGMVLPPVLVPRMLRELAWTAVYAPNVQFALRNVDYLSDKNPSVFQQYWSLGVEEQFYLVWPVLLWVICALTKKRLRHVAMLVTGLVLLSFGAGILVTNVSQPLAFYMLPMRAWELGAGALLAIVVLRRGKCADRLLALVLGVIGMGLVLAAAFLFANTTPFPSYFALVPVVGTTLIIYAGNDMHRTTFARILGARFIQWLGLVSYSLYLIHWPVFMLASFISDADETPWVAALMVLICLLLAWGLHRWVEVPFRYANRRSASRGPIVFALVFGVVTAVVSHALIPLIAARPLYGGPRIEATGPPAAEPAFDDIVPENLTPGLMGAEEDAPGIHTSGCHLGRMSVDPTPCKFGLTGPSVRLFGDSHAASWSPAFEELAGQGRLVLMVNTKGSCPSVFIHVEDYPECEKWRESVIHDATVNPTDVLVVANSDLYSSLGANSEAVWADSLRRLRERLPVSTRVIVFQDVPSFSNRPSVCLSQNLRSAQNCRQPMGEVVDEGVRLANLESGLAHFDPTRYLCSQGECSPMVGVYLAYMDSGHLSATFSRAMVPRIWDELELLLDGPSHP